jgi:uncharacterized protein YbaA (DUF1428 family)
MGYVDCFVAPVKQDDLPRYLDIARQQGELWMRCGALDYRECVADDLAWGIATSFPRSVRLEEGELIVLSWATYRSREHRDEVLALARDDPWHALIEHGEMPFDMRRVYFGGFEEVLAFGTVSAAPPGSRMN